jgi:hypothetical protein
MLAFCISKPGGVSRARPVPSVEGGLINPGEGSGEMERSENVVVGDESVVFAGVVHPKNDPIPPLPPAGLLGLRGCECESVDSAYSESSVNVLCIPSNCCNVIVGACCLFIGSSCCLVSCSPPPVDKKLCGACDGFRSFAYSADVGMLERRGLLSFEEGSVLTISESMELFRSWEGLEKH